MIKCFSYNDEFRVLFDDGKTSLDKIAACSKSWHTLGTVYTRDAKGIKTQVTDMQDKLKKLEAERDMLREQLDETEKLLEACVRVIEKAIED